MAKETRVALTSVANISEQVCYVCWDKDVLRLRGGGRVDIEERERERALQGERGARTREDEDEDEDEEGDEEKGEKERGGMMEKKEKRQYLRLKSRACCVSLGSPTHRSLIGNQIKNQNQKSNNYIN